MIYQLTNEEKQLALSEAERRQSVNEQNNTVGRKAYFVPQSKLWPPEAFWFFFDPNDL